MAKKLNEVPVMRKVQSFFNKFLLGERRWGLVRLAVTALFIILFTYLGHYAFRSYDLRQVVQTWVDHQALLKLVPGIILEMVALLIFNFRFLWLSLSSLVVALLIGAGYLTRIYERTTIWQTLSYLVRSLFSLRLPRIMVDDGKLQVDDSEPNLIRDIGGPGYIIIQPGNVVLFEHLHKPSKIQSEGVHFISRFETIRRFRSDYEKDGREIPTLDERHGFLEGVSATTKDGIAVIVEDINYRYRLRLGREFGDFVNRDTENPNPFSIQAVKNMAYNRSIRIKNPETGETELTPWHDMVNSAVQGAVTDYIREHPFNEVVVPAHPTTPRQMITDKIFSKGVRTRLRTFGAELLWWDIGHFEIADPAVANQLVDNWAVKWEGSTAFNLAYADAVRLRNLEKGRAEAQAEMLKAIIEAFENIQFEQAGPGKIRNLLLARLAQLLDSMRDQRQLSSGSGGGELPPP